ncbi:radical SAM domain-containing protein [Candidatus Magnetomorum sp. HK-1]|nr:radical SAM domain-containing protein [Candidatus Magnetomorum sp. HK-1]
MKYHLNKDSIKIVFIRPPCHLWPLLNESDNFLMPLSFPSLSAYLKREMQGVSVKIIDCLPLKIGYKSLQKMIADEKPDVVGVGDCLPYIYEGLKTLKLAKKINPDVITIVGGHFHSHMIDYSLNNHPEIDFIVRYEGEKYLKDLLEALRNGYDLSNVKSIAYRDNGKNIETELGTLIKNLDSLPIPDYDAMPVEKYAPFGKLFPKAITIQASRGCPMNCEYCSWSAQEGEHKLINGKTHLIPSRRTKSVDRVMEEIDILYKKFGIRYFFWVDGTWNYDTEWLDALCSEIIKKKYKLGWWAFVRADLLLEQEKQGVLEKMVYAGLKHILIGGERCTEADMKFIGKAGLNGLETYEVTHLLKKKYPGVFRQGTFITGIRTETKKSMAQLGAYVRKTAFDFVAFHPIMPYPGTPLWEKANKEGWIEVNDFSKYDMFHPIISSKDLSREEIASLNNKLHKDFVKKRPTGYLKGLFSRVKIRRTLHIWFLFTITRLLLRDMYLAFKGEKKLEGFAAINQLWKPKWYND